LKTFKKENASELGTATRTVRQAIDDRGWKGKLGVDEKEL
jgi:hypothetical protein